jgi:hypothetical protein
MNFTSKANIVAGLLFLAVLGMITGVFDRPAAIAEPQQSVQPASSVPLVPAVDIYQATPPSYYSPVAAWYKNKQWWKRNAPIVGGAAGGALFGGLLGGGKGALIGGAVGGGGGYAYKRLSHRHKNHNHNQNYNQNYNHH